MQLASRIESPVALLPEIKPSPQILATERREESADRHMPALMDGIEREYERLRVLSPDKLGKPPVASEPRTSESLEKQVREVVAALDSQGRWVESGRMRNYGADDGTRRVIESRTFIKNVGILSQYLAATRN